MIDPQSLRGIRNNNPGNIDKGQNWEGLAPEQPDPRFCTFIDPEHGIRAMHLILQTYQTKYGLWTIFHILSRWAPKEENDLVAYVNDVEQRMGIDEDAEIKVMEPATAFSLVNAIIAHEDAGFQYPEETVWKGLQLAGVVLPV